VNAQGASKSELLRGIAVFNMSQLPFLVANARMLLGFSRKVLGDAVTDAILQHTFFGHFCAGTSPDSIRPTLLKLQQSGVGSILDYAAEADVSGESESEPARTGADDQPDAAAAAAAAAAATASSSPGPTTRTKRDVLSVHERDTTQARTYEYQGEATCDLNTDITIRSIETAARLSQETGLPGFAAVKVTSIGQPDLLLHVSQAVANNKALFLRTILHNEGAGVGPEGQGSATVARKGTTASSGAAADTAASMRRQLAVEALRHPSVPQEVTDFALDGVLVGPGEMDLLVQATDAVAAAGVGADVGGGDGLSISLEMFRSAIAQSGVTMDQREAEDLFHRIDTDGSGGIDALEWTEYVTMQALASQPILPSNIARPGAATHPLREAEVERLGLMLDRARRLSDAAQQHGVSIMFDAEQTYLQPAIDHVVMNAQREFNQERAVVFNTYQGYLRDANDRLEQDMERARRGNFVFGAKLVRGAYMLQERQRAAEMGYRSPIHSTIERTHESYQAAWGRILPEVAAKRAELMVATHNQESVTGVIGAMRDLGIEPRLGGVSFGQLLGMCDHVSINLGKAGYSVYKYVPYGPVKDVVPYLVRRAEENSTMLSSAPQEIAMRWKEYLRRPPIGIH
jgi:hypothetical protein